MAITAVLVGIREARTRALMEDVVRSGRNTSELTELPTKHFSCLQGAYNVVEEATHGYKVTETVYN